MNDRGVASPDFYDDLGASLDAAWDLLIRGARDRQLMAHTPTVATVDAAGVPTLRTVVLRDCDPDSRALVFNTDRRSAKFEHLRRQPLAALHLYEPAEKIQLRLRCRVSLHTDDDIMLERWANTPQTSRVCYHVMQAPGVQLADPYAIENSAQRSSDGIANYAVVRAIVDELEWLYLSSAGHRRARYTWTNGEIAAQWLVP